MDAGSMINMVFNVGIAIVVLGVIVGGILLSRRQQSQAAAGQGPYAEAAQALSRALTTRLGYVSAAAETGGRGYGGQAARTKMVRTVGTRPLSWTSETLSTGRSVRVALAWELTLASPARVPLHVASAQLAGLMGSATDAMLSRSRSFRPRYSVAIPVAAPQLASKLVAYSEPGYEAAASAVLADPTLQQMLAQLTHIDLVVESGAVRLEDPFQENLTALMGGPMNMLKMLTPDGIERTVWMHDAIGQLLTRAADLTS